MKAMLLAAGRGERMGPLTSDLPKPLLSLGSESLIERHLRRLAAAGFREIVINLSYRGGQIRAAIGDRTPWGQSVVYSEEGEPPLETAGGIVHALPLLGDGPFVAVSTDVVTDYDFRALRAVGAEASGHLVLVPNPPHHPDGDFGLTSDGRIHIPEGTLPMPEDKFQMPGAGSRAPGSSGTPDSRRQTPESAPGAAPPRHTFSGIAVLHPALFRGLAPGIRPLRDVLFPAARRGALLGEAFEGLWRDVGTPERLADARALMSESPHPNGGARRTRPTGGGARRSLTSRKAPCG